MTRQASPRDSRRALVASCGAFLVLVVAPVVLVKRLDQDNRFCVACHLHQDLYRKTAQAPPTTLAAAHFRARHPGHAERCFTCHSGEGVVGWSQVTVLSAWDAARWVAGDRHEPTAMRLPLANRACLKCHDRDVRGTKTGEETEKYHELSDHRAVPLACVACHQTHRVGTKARTFLDDAVVRGQCARCHRRLDENGGQD